MYGGGSVGSGFEIDIYDVHATNHDETVILNKHFLKVLIIM